MLLLNDARTYQILFLSFFLLLGICTRDWTLQPAMVGVAIATCVVMQWGMMAISTGRSSVSYQGPDVNGTDFQSDADVSDPSRGQESGANGSAVSAALAMLLPRSFLASLPSALITSLGLSILLRADHYSTMALACSVAIASKFLIRVRGKHVFNPGNLGIVAALTLTPDAWVSPGQWGEEGWYALLFLSCGGLVVQRVGRWDTTVMFLGSYAVLEAIRNLWLGWTWDVWAHRLMSGSLLMFALFMITDPRTIPNARVGRLIWAGAIALLTFYLRNYLFISTAVFWALCALAPLSIVLDAMVPSDRFVWRTPTESTEPEARRQEPGISLPLP